MLESEVGLPLGTPKEEGLYYFRCTHTYNGFQVLSFFEGFSKISFSCRLSQFVCCVVLSLCSFLKQKQQILKHPTAKYSFKKVFSIALATTKITNIKNNSKTPWQTAIIGFEMKNSCSFTQITGPNKAWIGDILHSGCKSSLFSC